MKEIIKSIIRAVWYSFFKTNPKVIYKVAFLKDYVTLWQEGFSKFSKYFQEHYYQNINQIQSMIEKLKSGLDEESKKTIDKVLYRYINVLFSNPTNLPALLPAKVLFDEDELELQKKTEAFMKKIKQTYKLPIDHYETSVFYYDSGLTLLSNYNIKPYLKNKIFIDGGGGYIGDSALVLAKYDPKTILSFEPTNQNYDRFMQTLKLNPDVAKICKVLKLGLGDKSEKKEICVVGSSSSVVVEYEGLQKHEIEIVSLDSFLDQDEFRDSKVGLIKLDIEGYEYNAIVGSIETIKRDRPILLISIYHMPKDFFEIKPFLESQVSGYRYMIRKLNPHHPTYETMLIGFPEEVV